jgi:AcrR family transcriptional regulator
MIEHHVPSAPMPRAGDRPLQPGPDERRRRLVRRFADTVEPLLAAGRSYPELSVRELITVAGISRSTFYAYFADKTALLDAMTDDVSREVFDAAETWFALDRPTRRADFDRALEPLFASYVEHQALFRAIADAAAQSPAARRNLERIVGRAADRLTQHIAAQQARGHAAPGDPRTTAAWLAWMVERGLHQLVPDADEEEIAALHRSMSDVAWRALYAGTDPAG